jgi:hypothetical protein
MRKTMENCKYMGRGVEVEIRAQDGWCVINIGQCHLGESFVKAEG